MANILHPGTAARITGAYLSILTTTTLPLEVATQYSPLSQQPPPLQQLDPVGQQVFPSHPKSEREQQAIFGEIHLQFHGIHKIA